MGYKYGLLSDRKCKELRNMGIECPDKTLFKNNGEFQPEGEYYVYNEDESIVLTECFHTRNEQKAIGDTRTLYLFVVNNVFYLINLEKIEFTTVNEKSVHAFYFSDDSSIMNNPEDIQIFKEALINYELLLIVRWQKKQPDFEVKVYLGGKEL